MNKQEKVNYEDLVSSIDKDISDTQSLIEALRGKLSQARLVQQHRQEYDAMAGTIMKTPARQETTDRINQLEKQLEGLAVKQAQLVEKLSIHRKQGYLLSFALHQLIDILDNEQSNSDDYSAPMDVV